MFFLNYWFENSKRQKFIEKLDYILYCLRRDHEILYTLIDLIFEFLLFYYVYIGCFIVIGCLALKYYQKIAFKIKKFTKRRQVYNQTGNEKKVQPIFPQKSSLKPFVKQIKINASCSKYEKCPTTPTLIQKNESICFQKTQSIIQIKLQCRYCGKIGHELENCALRKKVLDDIKVKQELFKTKMGKKILFELSK